MQAIVPLIKKKSFLTVPSLRMFPVFSFAGPDQAQNGSAKDKGPKKGKNKGKTATKPAKSGKKSDTTPPQPDKTSQNGKTNIEKKERNLKRE